MRYYVVSDIHGYYTQMKSALEKAGFFSDTTPHKLIMLGDLFDRGHEAKQASAVHIGADGARQDNSHSWKP